MNLHKTHPFMIKAVLKHSVCPICKKGFSQKEDGWEKRFIKHISKSPCKEGFEELLKKAVNKEIDDK